MRQNTWEEWALSRTKITSISKYNCWGCLDCPSLAENTAGHSYHITQWLHNVDKCPLEISLSSLTSFPLVTQTWIDPTVSRGERLTYYINPKKWRYFSNRLLPVQVSRLTCSLCSLCWPRHHTNQFCFRVFQRLIVQTLPYSPALWCFPPLPCVLRPPNWKTRSFCSVCPKLYSTTNA